MNQSTRDLLRAAAKEFSELSYIRPEDIPDIPLYMDQITSFMDAKLETCKRHPDDKILTKTMINNYTKNKLIPPPEKKKYSRDHLLLLIYVYYLKDFLQISDIQTLLQPLEEHFFQKDGELSMPDIYETAVEIVSGQKEEMMKDLVRRFEIARKAFPEAEKDEENYLQIFSFVTLLSFDVYVKKKLIESIVDQMLQKESGRSGKKDKKD